MKTKSELLANLAKTNPEINVRVSYDRDDYFVWDGDGPDPADSGFEAYDINVKASKIVGGQLLEGDAYLGGSYYARPGEFDPEINGYFPQLLEEALEDLSHQ